MLRYVFAFVVIVLARWCVRCVVTDRCLGTRCSHRRYAIVESLFTRLRVTCTTRWSRSFAAIVDALRVTAPHTPYISRFTPLRSFTRSRCTVYVTLPHYHTARVRDFCHTLPDTLFLRYYVTIAHAMRFYRYVTAILCRYALSARYTAALRCSRCCRFRCLYYLSRLILCVYTFDLRSFAAAVTHSTPLRTRTIVLPAFVPRFYCTRAFAFCTILRFALHSCVYARCRTLPLAFCTFDRLRVACVYVTAFCHRSVLLPFVPLPFTIVLRVFAVRCDRCTPHVALFCAFPVSCVLRLPFIRTHAAFARCRSRCLPHNVARCAPPPACPSPDSAVHLPSFVRAVRCAPRSVTRYAGVPHWIARLMLPLRSRSVRVVAAPLLRYTAIRAAVHTTVAAFVAILPRRSLRSGVDYAVTTLRLPFLRSLHRYLCVVTHAFSSFTHASLRTLLHVAGRVPPRSNVVLILQRFTPASLRLVPRALRPHARVALWNYRLFAVYLLPFVWVVARCAIRFTQRMRFTDRSFTCRCRCGRPLRTRCYARSVRSTAALRCAILPLPRSFTGYRCAYRLPDLRFLWDRYRFRARSPFALRWLRMRVARACVYCAHAYCALRSVTAGLYCVAVLPTRTFFCTLRYVTLRVAVYPLRSRYFADPFCRFDHTRIYRSTCRTVLYVYVPARYCCAPHAIVAARCRVPIERCATATRVACMITFQLRLVRGVAHAVTVWVQLQLPYALFALVACYRFSCRVRTDFRVAARVCTF